MLILQVHIRVKAEHVEAFKQITEDNASNSLKEPGVRRFDMLQQQDDPTRFVLLEVYRDDDAATAHKATAHYNRWAEKVGDLLAEPRTRYRYSNVFPGDESW